MPDLGHYLLPFITQLGHKKLDTLIVPHLHRADSNGTENPKMAADAAFDR